MMPRVLLLPVLLVALAPGVAPTSAVLRPAATRPLDLQVKPRATQSPGTVRVTATIERDAANRKITIEVESPAFYRSSSRTLDGAAAVRKYTRVFSGLTTGTYEIRATLERNDGTRLVDALSLLVKGPRK